MHEHRNYLPSLGIFVIISAVLLLSDKLSSILKLIACAGLISFTLYCALLSHLRADMYGNDFRRTQIEAQFRMESVRSQYEAGALMVNLYNAKREPMLYALADKHFERATAMDSSHKLSLIGRLQLDCLSETSIRTPIFDELKSRLKNSKWMPSDRMVMHGLSEMSNEKRLCLERKQVDELFTAALTNPSASVVDRSVVTSDYATYLWVGEKDYAAARDVLYRSTNENENDVLNRLNLLQLLRFLGDRKGVLELLGDLENRTLSRRDGVQLQSIQKELVTEGVLAN
jgi:hypothetical protein